jgi:hypothetical protein
VTTHAFSANSPQPLVCRQIFGASVPGAWRILLGRAASDLVYLFGIGTSDNVVGQVGLIASTENFTNYQNEALTNFSRLLMAGIGQLEHAQRSGSPAPASTDSDVKLVTSDPKEKSMTPFARRLTQTVAFTVGLGAALLTSAPASASGSQSFKSTLHPKGGGQMFKSAVQTNGGGDPKGRQRSHDLRDGRTGTE